MLFKRIVLMFGVVLLGIVFIGCDQTDNTLSNLEETIMQVETISYEENFDSFVSLSLEANQTTTKLSESNLRENFLNLRAELYSVHYEFMEAVYRNKQTIIEIRTQIKDLKSNETSLSEEEINLIKEQIVIIKENRKAIFETKGEAYLRLKELRGQYDLEHYDLVTQTITEVTEVIDQRLINIIIIEESLLEIKTILNN